MEETLLKFLSIAGKLKSELRHNCVNENRAESAAEHTWRMCLFLMVYKDLFKLEEDFNKVMEMLIIHDLPEIITGDTPHFQQTENTKKLELQTAGKAFDSLPKDLAEKYLNLYKEFEEGETSTAKIAQAIDKLESQLQVYDSNFCNWKDPSLKEELLTYPNKAVNKLNDPNFNKIWYSLKNKLKQEIDTWE